MDFVTIHSERLNPNMKPESKYIYLAAKQHIFAEVLLPIYRKKSWQKDGTCSPAKRIAFAEYRSWLHSKLAYHGLALKEAQWDEPTFCHINKPGNIFVIPSIRYRFNAQIADVQLAARAFLFGIGTNRGFGFGMLQVIEDE